MCYTGRGEAFSRKGTEFPSVFQLKLSKMSANYQCVFCLQPNKIPPTEEGQPKYHKIHGNSLSLWNWTGIHLLSSANSSSPFLCFNYQQNLLNTHSVGKQWIERIIIISMWKPKAPIYFRLSDWILHLLSQINLCTVLEVIHKGIYFFYLCTNLC